MECRSVGGLGRRSVDGLESMKYISTRGGMASVRFSEAVMMGLAPDGGLILPERIPDVSGRLDEWAALPYPELAQAVMSLYTDLPEAVLKDLVTRSYATFDHPDVTPVVPVGDIHLLELFHGPTLAFKDVALQFLGNLFEYILEKDDRRLNILGATSGDTGSAAIHGIRGRDRIRIFVMHPKGRVSPVQERQMTSILDDNVFNLAVEGTFDDCQAIMKTLFNDLEFKERCALGSVNSINWARVLAQIVYYFHAGLRVRRETGAEQVQFSIPTGNFGDIFAGYLAARMGLPVSRLILATNENNILARFFNSGVYSVGEVVQSISPSMDIQVASNFERYLYYRLGRDSLRLKELMDRFATTQSIETDALADEPADRIITADSANTAATLKTIRTVYEKHGYLLDPHAAVGVHVGIQSRLPGDPLICLATAHPAKFGAVINDALGRHAAHHSAIDALEGLPTRYDTLPDSAPAVRNYIEKRVTE